MPRPLVNGVSPQVRSCEQVAREAAAEERCGCGTWLRLSVGYDSEVEQLKEDVVFFISSTKAAPAGGNPAKTTEKEEGKEGKEEGVFGISDEFVTPTRWRRCEA